ncbi:YuzF family protein [Bacillus sp. Hm123]|uniref:YuzF family protein n=1 Tax=Bacillus sp. Hm123 TaxID=3450745 RepID=UPI003F41B9D1
MNQQTPSFASHIDPYVYQMFQGVTGTELVVQTTQGTVSGRLKTVMPDHIVVESGGSPFYIRIQQIVWVIPRG